VVANSPAPVVLSTLLRNPEYPPSGTLAVGQPGCKPALGVAQDRALALPERATRLAEACGDSAITAWIESRWHSAERREEEALIAWRRSLQLDALPMRAPLEADDVIRRVAAEQGATLLDLERAFGAMPPGAWFSDSLHLRPEGHEAVAAALEPVIREQLGLPPGSGG